MRFAIAVCLLVACGLVVAVHHDEFENPTQFNHMNAKAKRSVMNGLPYAYGYNHVPIEPFMTFDYRQPFGELRPEVDPDDRAAADPDVVYRVLMQRAAAARSSAEAAQDRGGVAIQVTGNLVYDYEGPTAVTVDGHRPSDVAETLTFRRYDGDGGGGEYGETAAAAAAGHQQQVIFDESVVGARPIIVITLLASAGEEKNAADNDYQRELYEKYGLDAVVIAADDVDDATPGNPTDVLAAFYKLEEATATRQITTTTAPADNGDESAAIEDERPQTTAAPIYCDDDEVIVLSADADDDDGTTADADRPDNRISYDPETNEIADGGHSSSSRVSAEQIAATQSPAAAAAADGQEQNGNDDDDDDDDDDRLTTTTTAAEEAPEPTEREEQVGFMVDT